MLLTIPRALPAIALLAHWLFPAMATSDSHFNITTVSGYFYQDEPDTDPSQFDYVLLPSPPFQYP